MKKTVLLFVILCTLQIAKAQKKQNVYYLKNNGKEVNLKDSADFIRIIQEPDSGETNFILQEFYANGKRKTAGKVSAFEPRLVYEGVIAHYNKEGKRINISTFENGSLLGMSYLYFSNGKLYKQTEYLPSKPQGNFLPTSGPAIGMGAFNPSSKLIYLADSLGVEQVKDGNGYAKTVEVIGKNEMTDEGTYTDGVKNGVWKGRASANGTSYIETYEMGKLIGGESTKDGMKYPYTANSDQPPSFVGGINKFYEYLGRSVRYPSDAEKNRITGAVQLSFTIERDGRLTDVKVERAVYPSLDEEAKRAVMSSPKWVPGTQRGLPVRVKYNIPVNFSLP